MPGVQVHAGRLPTAGIKYRPDIDGLRALAILSVVGFHAFPDLVRGGFVGVDVFFVISGFLISRVIADDLQAGRFSFRVFYQRRIRRIFPALILVLVGCALAGWFLLAPDAYAGLGTHIAGGAGFVANLVLWKEAGYFDGSSETKPLLHLWSLGIEEQFYFIWPLVLWLAWRRRWNLLLVTTIVLLASFAANLVMVQTDAVANFYSPFTRIWELLIGALVAGSSAMLESRARRQRWSDALAAAGLATILVAELTLTRAAAFPGWWALLPTIGAASIIAAGPTAWVNRTLLSFPGMVWIGLISYPLYLWHWPLLAFMRITGVLKGETGIAAVAVCAAFVLSWLTYRWIERPLRAVRTESPRRAERVDRPAPGFRTAALLLFMSFAAVLGGAIQQANGSILRERFKVASLPPLPDKSVFEALKTYEHYDTPNHSCRDRLNREPLAEEVCVTNSSAPKVLFFGDSHAMGLYSAVFANRLAIPSVLIASPGCLVYPALEYRPNGKEWGQDCREIARRGLAYATASSSVGTVVISLVRKGDHPSSLTNFHSGERRLTELEVLDSGPEQLVGALLKTGKTVVFVVDVPYFHDTPEDCQAKFRVSGADPCVFSKATMDEPFKAYFAMLERLGKKYPALKVLNAEDVLCGSGRCAQHDGSRYFYIDKDHLSVYGSERVLSSLLERIPLN